MWARICELFMGAWLLASPVVFDHAQDAIGLWAIDIGTGAALIGVATFSCFRPLSRYYAIVPVIGVFLIGSAFLSGPHPISAAGQNHIIVGLIILMLGIVPNQALQPPVRWREFEQETRGEGRESSGDSP